MIYTVLAQCDNSSGDAKAMRSFRNINEKNQNHSLLIVYTRPQTQRNTWPLAKADIFLCGCQTQLKSTVI